jgi:hypothetical protein
MRKLEYKQLMPNGTWIRWGFLEGKEFTYPKFGCDYFPITEQIHCQNTGLKDKDGEFIYEDDVIEFYGVACRITWDDSDASFFAESSDSTIYESGQEWSDNCYIIGNINTHKKWGDLV